MYGFSINIFITAAHTMPRPSPSPMCLIFVQARPRPAKCRPIPGPQNVGPCRVGAPPLTDDNNRTRRRPDICQGQQRLALTDPYRLVAPSDGLIELLAGAALHARPPSTRSQPLPQLASARDAPCTQQNKPSSVSAP